MAQLVKNLPAIWEAWVQSLGWEDPWKRESLPTSVFWPGEFKSDTTEQLSLSLREFPGDLVVRALHLHRSGPGSILGQGTKLPSHTKQPKKERTI